MKEKSIVMRWNSIYVPISTISVLSLLVKLVWIIITTIRLKKSQIEAFKKQMDLAEEFNLPVEIHTRDAEDDTIEILKEYKGRVKGIIHCFTGTQQLADAALDCGYNISFSGVVTFKNAEDLRQVCLNTPIDRMHVETDAPFLAPVPLRGQKNQPDFVLWVAKFVSELKGVPLKDFCHQMKTNADKMFPKLISN